MSEDWVDDAELSPEETLARFEALHPQPANVRVPGGGQLGQEVSTYGGPTIVHTGGSLVVSHSSVSDGVPQHA